MTLAILDLCKRHRASEMPITISKIPKAETAIRHGMLTKRGRIAGKYRKKILSSQSVDQGMRTRKSPISKQNKTTTISKNRFILVKVIWNFRSLHMTFDQITLMQDDEVAG